MKIKMAVLIAVVCFSTSASAQKLRVDASLEGYPFDVIYVRGEIPKSNVFFDDTIKVVGGNFSYEREMTSPVRYTFVPKNMGGRLCLMASGGETLTVKGNYAQFARPVVTGSPTNDSFEEIAAKYHSQLEAIRVAQNQLYEHKSDDEVKIKLKDEHIAARQCFAEQLVKDKNLKNRQAVSYYLYQNLDFTNLKHAKKVMGGLSSALLGKDVYYTYLSAYLKREFAAVEGVVAFDFELKDVDGKSYRLSDFKGKYVLIEFSASWCGWCKKEIPFLEKIYAMREDKDIVVITVNMDTTQELFVKEAAHVPWLTLSDLMAYDSPTIKGYNVSGIPQIFIVNRKGKIISKDLRGERLVEYVKNLKK